MWMIERYFIRRGKQRKYEHPRIVCSNCGANYSKYWLTFIANEINPIKIRSADTPPQYCPECGFFHGGTIGGDSDAES